MVLCALGQSVQKLHILFSEEKRHSAFYLQSGTSPQNILFSVVNVPRQRLKIETTSPEGLNLVWFVDH